MEDGGGGGGWGVGRRVTSVPIRSFIRETSVTSCLRRGTDVTGRFGDFYFYFLNVFFYF